MNKLFSTLVSTIVSKFTSLWTRIRLFVSPAFWRAQVFTRLRQWLTRVFDVKPKHRGDYYSIARWMVSKRLAFAIVIVLGLLSGYFIWATVPSAASGEGGTARTYRYNAIALKFYTGNVRILARDGHLAYVGAVDQAQCTGKGTLYNKDEVKVYEGAFADSKFNGTGELYYPDGTARYQGAFVDNLYHGKGTAFYPTGTMEYKGDYLAGLRAGQGELYNSAGSKIFTGSFQRDRIVYSEFLDKDTALVAEMYSGATGVYSGGAEYCVAMPEINAVYSIADGSNSLDENWTVNSIYVLEDRLMLEGNELTTINEVTAALGNPDYLGTTWVNLPEAVAANLLARTDETLLGRVEMSTTADFDNVFTVNSYNRDFQIYIYTYRRDGLLYTFYCTGAGVENFVMYAIEMV